LRALEKLVGPRTATVGQLADEVGRGYGLSGDHRAWARTPEREIGELISPRLRALLDNTTVPRSANSVTDAFFGARDGLGVSLAPAGRTSVAEYVGTAAGSRGSNSAAAEADAPPRMLKRPTWVAPTLVAATALLAGVVLALLFI
jgi:hypothetical protein